MAATLSPTVPTQATPEAPPPVLLDWLAGHGVDYELTAHPRTVTARETARAEGLDPHRFAKALGVVADDGRRALMVIEATEKLDIGLARRILGAREVRLMTETELEALAPGFPAGTVPPIGELFGVPVYADLSLREDAEITFHAGSHHVTATVERTAWERAVGVAYAALAVSAGEPAWARS